MHAHHWPPIGNHPRQVQWSCNWWRYVTTTDCSCNGSCRNSVCVDFLAAVEYPDLEIFLPPPKHRRKKIWLAVVAAEFLKFISHRKKLANLRPRFGLVCLLYPIHTGNADATQLPYDILDFSKVWIKQLLTGWFKATVVCARMWS